MIRKLTDHELQHSVLPWDRPLTAGSKEDDEGLLRTKVSQYETYRSIGTRRNGNVFLHSTEEGQNCGERSMFVINSLWSQ